MRYAYLILLPLMLSCRHVPKETYLPIDTVYAAPDTANRQVSDTALPGRIVAFAKTLLGTPYRFGCTAPSTGFDCSGFVNYVFNHFGIAVPRSSVDFTNEGTTIPLAQCQPGDLILFTGTNSKIRVVGHIGIIIANDSSGVTFIHASSGADEAVITTKLNERYMERFVKTIRLTPNP